MGGKCICYLKQRGAGCENDKLHRAEISKKNTSVAPDAALRLVYDRALYLLFSLKCCITLTIPQHLHSVLSSKPLTNLVSMHD